MKYVAIATLAVLFVVPEAFAKSVQTGWINAQKFESQSRTLKRQGMMPLSIRCKNAGKIGQNRKNTLLNVKFVSNPKGTRYHWVWGSNLKVIGRRLEKRGFKRVSYHSFTRPNSGLMVPCGIWHKKR